MVIIIARIRKKLNRYGISYLHPFDNLGIFNMSIHSISNKNQNCKNYD